MIARNEGRLIVVPSEPIEAYERVGLGGVLEKYYNPTGLFKEVFAVSPLEPPGSRRAHGMTVIGGTVSRTAQIMRELKPDIVRAYGGYWASDFACRHRVPGVPLVVSVHDPHPTMVHRSVACADLVFCTSEVVERIVQRRGAPANRLRRLPNRIDRSVFKPVRDPARLQSVAKQFPPNRRYILHVGRKSTEKNIPTLIRALTRLPDHYAAVFVGRGNPRSFQRLARKAQVSSRCFWIESVPNDQLPLWYCWCDCMCTPSLWEGFGRVFIEAAACGAAVITSNIAPMNEYLTHGVNAHLVGDYRQAEALAAAIRKVTEDDAYRQRISANAVKAMAVFDRATIDALEANLYREAMSMEPRELTTLERSRIILDNAGRKLRAAANIPHKTARRWVRRLIRARTDPQPG